MREPEMFEPMVGYLKGQGYVILQVNRGKQPGPDVLAEKSGKKLVVQMKGDSAAIKTDWDTGLGQLLDLMNDGQADYAMAVSERYERLVKGFPFYAKNKLQLIFFMIKDNGVVKSIE